MEVGFLGIASLVYVSVLLISQSAARYLQHGGQDIRYSFVGVRDRYVPYTLRDNVAFRSCLGLISLPLQCAIVCNHEIEPHIQASRPVNATVQLTEVVENTSRNTNRKQRIIIRKENVAIEKQPPIRRGNT